MAVMTRGKLEAIVLCEEEIEQDRGGRDELEEEVEQREEAVGRD